MGYFVGIPLGGAAEKDCQVRFGKNMTFQVETRAPHLPAECKGTYGAIDVQHTIKAVPARMAFFVSENP